MAHPPVTAALGLQDLMAHSGMNGESGRQLSGQVENIAIPGSSWVNTKRESA